jgi:hypothetical protein
VILAPNLYWFKRSPIAITNRKKANALAESILKDRPKRFSEIKIIKNGSEYYFFAYDKNSIVGLLQKLGLFDAKLYFAQLIFENCDFNLAIDETKMLSNINTMVVQLSSKTTDSEDGQMVLLDQFVQNFKYKKNHFFLSASASDNQSANKTITNLSIALLLIITVAFALNFYQLYSQNRALDTQIQGVDFDGKNSYVVKSLITKWEEYETTKQNRNQQLQEAAKSGQKSSSMRFEDK